MRMGVFGVRGEAKIIGTVELVTAAILIIGSVVQAGSALGAALASVILVLTTSFAFSTPGITLQSPTGFPIIPTLVEQFLIKDVALLAACLTLLLASFSPGRPKPCGDDSLKRTSLRSGIDVLLNLH